MAEFQHRRDLFGRARQNHGERQTPVGGERIRLEDAPLVLAGDQGTRRQQRSKARNDHLAAGEDTGIGWRKGNVAHAFGLMSRAWVDLRGEGHD